MRNALLSLTLLGALAAPAAAQEMDSGGGGGNTGIGVGAEAMLSGDFGATVVYDAAAWRINGILGFDDFGDNQDILLAGRFVYVLHNGVASDFGIGAGLGLLSHDQGGMAEDYDDILIEGLAQLRAFVTPNVALSASAGIGFTARDDIDDELFLTGQLIGSVGVAYYFW